MIQHTGTWLFKPVLILFMILPVSFISGCAKFFNPDLHPQGVAVINPQKASGKWYEIASIPKGFATNCHCSYGEYQPLEKAIKATNYCRRGAANGPTSRASARLYPIPNTGNHKLLLKFSWPFQGEYWIIYMDPNYQYALSGTPSRRYLWITSKKPYLDQKTINKLKDIAKKQGYPVEKLKMTDQSCWQ